MHSYHAPDGVVLHVIPPLANSALPDYNEVRVRIDIVNPMLAEG